MDWLKHIFDAGKLTKSTLFSIVVSFAAIFWGKVSFDKEPLQSSAVFLAAFFFCQFILRAFADGYKNWVRAAREREQAVEKVNMLSRADRELLRRMFFEDRRDEGTQLSTEDEQRLRQLDRLGVVSFSADSGYWSGSRQTWTTLNKTVGPILEERLAQEV